MSLKGKLFSFDGRLRRADWWIWGIALGLLWVVAETAASRLLFSDEADLDQAVFGDPIPVLAASLGLVVLTFWPTAALYAKRAHDLNWPAWPIIAALFVVVGLPYLPYDLTPALSDGPATGMDVALTVLSFILGIAWFGIVIILAFKDGSPAPNRFGPSPKAGALPTISEPGGME